MSVLFLTTPDLLAEHWPAVARLITPVVTDAARGEFTVGDIGDMLQSRQAFAGIAHQDGIAHLAMVWEFRHYPRRTVLNVIALGGADLAAVADSFWLQFVDWAKESGVQEIEACTSPAMSRVLRQMGFAHTYNVMRMPC